MTENVKNAITFIRSEYDYWKNEEDIPMRDINEFSISRIRYSNNNLLEYICIADEYRSLVEYTNTDGDEYGILTIYDMENIGLALRLLYIFGDIIDIDVIEFVDGHLTDWESVEVVEL